MPADWRTEHEPQERAFETRLPGSHHLNYRPPALVLHDPTGIIDWHNYLMWAESDLSYRERVDSNVFLSSYRANLVSHSNAIELFLSESYSRAKRILLFKDLPVVVNGEILGNQVWILSYDLTEREFSITWLETIPETLKQLETRFDYGQKVFNISFYEVCQTLERTEDIRNSFASWKQELGLKYCTLICMGTFILDFEEIFEHQFPGLWGFRALHLAKWRKMLRDFQDHENESIDLPLPPRRMSFSFRRLSGWFKGLRRKSNASSIASSCTDKLTSTRAGRNNSCSSALPSLPPSPPPSPRPTHLPILPSSHFSSAFDIPMHSAPSFLPPSYLSPVAAAAYDRRLALRTALSSADSPLTMLDAFKDWILREPAFDTEENRTLLCSELAGWVGGGVELGGATVGTGLDGDALGTNAGEDIGGELHGANPAKIQAQMTRSSKGKGKGKEKRQRKSVDKKVEWPEGPQQMRIYDADVETEESP